MPPQTDVEGGYKFLSAVLFLLVALPLAGYAIFPGNSYASFLSYPSRLLLVPIHEFGHLILIYFTEFSGIPSSYMDTPIRMTGSLFEVFVPFVFVFFFIFGSRRYALACLLLVVAGSALINWGAYIKSASNPSGSGINPYMELAEVSLENHDWYRVLSRYNALDKAELLGDMLMGLGFVVALMGFFSSVFEVNLVLNYGSSSDFMLLMLYGSIPTLILSLAYFKPSRIVFSLLLLIPLLIHFYKKVLPGLEEEMEEVDEEIKEEEAENEGKKNQTNSKVS
ncbi:hypothetical protein H0N99_03045 [Candidatus Micrarchaeota archaeon]|nr:hypothetical protein [Candidatus Micrarchaeota archaeon]